MVFKKSKKQTDIVDFIEKDSEKSSADSQKSVDVKSTAASGENSNNNQDLLDDVAGLVKESGNAGDFSTAFIVPLKDVVLYPKMVTPLFISRRDSLKALDNAMDIDGQVLFVAQKNKNLELVKYAKDMYSVGVLGKILQYVRLPDGAVKILVEGVSKCKLHKTIKKQGAWFVDYEIMHDESIENGAEKELLLTSLRRSFSKFANYSQDVSDDIILSLNQIQEIPMFINIVLSYLPVSIADKQDLLDSSGDFDRLEKLLVIIEKTLFVQDIDVKIKARVKNQIDKNQKDFYLNEQMKAIQHELGGEESETEEFEKILAEKKLDDEPSKKIKKEISKLKKSAPMSAEGTVIRNYLDTVLSLPWNKKKKLHRDLAEAKVVLDQEHYSMDKIKNRILENLAVQNRTGSMKGNILCFMGPPGVGKTSLAATIAKATGRDFVRVSLGGIKDESEIRGHRRTYIGAMPGRIIQSIKKAGSSNPLILLDEIDKMGSDWKGDPSSAMLEVLDPEQNNTFHDNYLDLDYDLSDVMFITTANSYDIPHALYDRMEMIELSGYTEDEKISIARKHVMPKKMKDCGLKDSEFYISDEGLRTVIRYYTGESGVRELSRVLESLMRKAVMELDSIDSHDMADMFVGSAVKIDENNIEKYLGVKKYSIRAKNDTDLVGVVNGLAFTSIGGTMLMIEAVSMPGKGECILTGSLGDVIKESIQAAHSYIKSNASSLGINAKFFEKNDIHVHIPDGATPVDGPSAGITIFTAIVSLLTGKPVKRDVAMTGEITLRGRVLPIGGLKEKLLAAMRGGVKTVLIPSENEKDLIDIPENVKAGMQIIPVKEAVEVLNYTF